MAGITHQSRAGACAMQSCDLFSRPSFLLRGGHLRNASSRGSEQLTVGVLHVCEFFLTVPHAPWIPQGPGDLLFPHQVLNSQYGVAHHSG